jgi:hypothetical protein
MWFPRLEVGPQLKYFAKTYKKKVKNAFWNRSGEGLSHGINAKIWLYGRCWNATLAL